MVKLLEMNFLSFVYPQTLEVIQSPINGEIKVIESFGKRILYVNGIEQTGGTITKLWQEAIGKIRNSRFPRQSADRQIRNCLVLGVGGGDNIKLVKKAWPDIKVTAVEIDLIMIDIAKKYFNLSQYSGLEIIMDDALFWVRKMGGKKRYELILVDLFIGKDNPFLTKKKSFLSDLKKLAGKNGLIVFNSQYIDNKKKELKQFIRLARQIYPRVDVILEYRYSRVILLS